MTDLNDKNALLDAMVFVNDAHCNRSKTDEGRFRKGLLIGVPYFTHVVEVMKRLYVYGYKGEDTSVLIGGLGHDLFEDTNVSYNEVVDLWGYDVADLIQIMTRKSGDDATKLQKLQFLKSIADSDNYTAINIKIADRYCNVKDYCIGDHKYAAKYALQAYPLYHKHYDTDPYGIGPIHDDIREMDQIIKSIYGKSYRCMNENEIKEIIL